MNIANAIGFFLLGTIMQVLPVILRLEAGATLGAEEAQALWLQFMGVVSAAIGGGYLLRIGAHEVSVMLARLAIRRAEAREQFAQGARAQQSMPLGVRVRF